MAGQLGRAMRQVEVVARLGQATRRAELCGGLSYVVGRAMWRGELCSGASYVAVQRKMERIAECLQNGHPYRGFWQNRNYPR